MRTVTCVAPVNIASIKYWGKRDEKLILPINDSLSVTLSTKVLCSTTSVTASQEFKKNRIWLNGKEESFDNPRLQSCLNELKERARKQNDGQSDGIYDWNVHVCSKNNFPTAAGLASSAAGYACFVYALAKLYDVEGDLTEIARMGSGSACRSIQGGFVMWSMGERPDGKDSVATQVAPASHWKELRILVLIVDARSKKVASSSGMRESWATSELLRYRASHCVPKRVKKCVDAILRKDFVSFAEETMKDSNQFHAVCLDSYPPIAYMNDTSHAIVQLIHAFNTACHQVKVAYTLDAGPNVCLFLQDRNVPLVMAFINHFFPSKVPTEDYVRGEVVESIPLPQEIVQTINSEPFPPGLITGIIHSQVGDGPQLLPESYSLLNNNGLPLDQQS